MPNGHEPPSQAELARSQQRIETMLSRMETMSEERHEQVLRQVSDVRHRVANLEAERALSKEFYIRVGSLFDRVEELEKHEIAQQAVTTFKRELLSMKWAAGILGTILVALQLWQMVNGG